MPSNSIAAMPFGCCPVERAGQQSDEENAVASSATERRQQGPDQHEREPPGRRLWEGEAVPRVGGAAQEDPDSGTAVASPGSYDAALLDALAEVIGEGLKPLTVR